MISWPKFNLPPINLWSVPVQDVEYMRDAIKDIEEVIYYTRTGKLTE